MDNIANGQINSFGIFLSDNFNNKNNNEIIILYCNIDQFDDFPLDILFESGEYEKMQDNIPLLPLIKSCNTLLNDLFKKLSNLDLLEFLDFQDLFNVENIQELNTMQICSPL